jgi:hypothetical protein
MSELQPLENTRLPHGDIVYSERRMRTLSGCPVQAAMFPGLSRFGNRPVIFRMSP